MTKSWVVVVVLSSSVVMVGTRDWARRGARRRLGLEGRRRVSSARPSPLEAWLAPRLAAADLDWPVGGVARAVTLGGLGAGVVTVAGRPVVGLLAALGAVTAVGALHLGRDRRRARLEAELPALLEAVARALRSGASLPVALREAASGGSVAAEALTAVLTDADRGLGLTAALGRWADRCPGPAVRLVAGALTVALAVGGSPARGVDGVAATLRERAEVEREARSLATQARASAAVVTLAPVGFGAVGALGDDRSAGFLLGTPAGLACLVGGLVLDGVGALWMHRIARGSA